MDLFNFWGKAASAVEKGVDTITAPIDNIIETRLGTKKKSKKGKGKHLKIFDENHDFDDLVEDITPITRTSMSSKRGSKKASYNNKGGARKRRTKHRR